MQNFLAKCRPASAGRNRGIGTGGAGPASPGPSAVNAALGAMSPGPVPGFSEGPPAYSPPSNSATGARGVREKIRPASAGAKNVWHDAQKELPTPPPHALTSGAVPQTQHASHAGRVGIQCVMQLSRVVILLWNTYLGTLGLQAKFAPRVPP